MKYLVFSVKFTPNSFINITLHHRKSIGRW